jgi:hypothetical protein
MGRTKSKRLAIDTKPNLQRSPYGKSSGMTMRTPIQIKDTPMNIIVIASTLEHGKKLIPLNGSGMRTGQPSGRCSMSYINGG